MVEKAEAKSANTNFTLFILYFLTAFLNSHNWIVCRIHYSCQVIPSFIKVITSGVQSFLNFNGSKIPNIGREDVKLSPYGITLSKPVITVPKLTYQGI